jgi:hypothetical protein
MAQPTVRLEGDTFIFTNDHVTIEAQLHIEDDAVTVASATLENHHHTVDPVDLGITNVEVPPPVIEHVSDVGFDLPF